jgi:hypothetical protein
LIGEKALYRFNFDERLIVLKKELAEQLGISGAMVSKLAKRGMPTDTVERAQRWRRRHLEPGRVKGRRMGTQAPPPPRPASRADSITAPVDKVESLAMEVDQFMVAFPGEPQTDDLIAQLRAMLRKMPTGSNPRFTLRVWLRLVDYCLHENAEARRNPNSDMVMDQLEFSALNNSDLGGEWLSIASDFEGYAVNGWPPEWEELED